MQIGVQRAEQRGRSGRCPQRSARRAAAVRPAGTSGRPGYLALFITHDGFWKSFAAEAGIAGFATMAERVAHRAEVLALDTAPDAIVTATA
ncbi:MAG TPA: hypothetical protein VFV73_43820 [Streptosporangiaceae bacterium]|nr:hypothetical protein [Streptosporangiaceae bacterium]